MSSQGTTPPLKKWSSSAPRRTPARKSAPASEIGTSTINTSSSSTVAERTVKKLRLTKALTIPEGTLVSHACRRMAARRVDAVLLTDSTALLSGIVTDKDITTRVIAEEFNPDQTSLAKIMTRNPIFVTSDTLAIEALQKMVQGKFRHLPVVENGEVIALLDITKCLYDAISGMEKAAEQFDGAERQLGSNINAPGSFIETVKERMFKPALSTIIPEGTKFSTVSPSDTVCYAAKKMRDACDNSVIIMSADKLQGILTSRDILIRIVAQNLSPDQTVVEKVMTSNPDCVTMDTTLLDALQMMRSGKFLHLPILDKDGSIVCCVDVLQLTHAALSMAENNSGSPSEMANTTLQKFWDSALSQLDLPDESKTHSEMSAGMTASEGTDLAKCASLGLENSFSFKVEDSKGRVHRFIFASDNLDELVSAVMQRIGSNDGGTANTRPQLCHKDDEGNKVLLTCDYDLIGAVLHAKSLGQKVLRLFTEFPEPVEESSITETTRNMTNSVVEKSGWTSLQSAGVLSGAVALTGVAVMLYLRRANLR